ncbi:protein FAM210A isoform X2 [Fopius arisanus]|uniref:Protein FAM210A isoform X2 n=1 Tax=Fopius arisanus TaxID=64838 RepID=A0A9R1SVK2_9HYME|nr:PREDICTED: protein FAM210A isoform X2 [Fopius arisanus]
MEFVMSRSVNRAGIFLRSYANLGVPNTLRNIRCFCQFYDTRWSDRVYDDRSRNSISWHNYTSNSLQQFRHLRNHESIGRTISPVYYCTAPKDQGLSPPEAPKKVSIFQKMKQLTKDYWHILIPVHIVTSIGWVSIFYVAAKNGVDVIQLMEYLHMSEKYINIIKNSNAGHWAVVYALYKIFTPLRYTVTVGGTTLSIRYLDRLGIMKFRRSTEAPRTSSTSDASKKNQNTTSPKKIKSD